MIRKNLTLLFILLAIVLVWRAADLLSTDETQFFADVRAILIPFANVYLHIFGHPETAIILSFLIGSLCLAFIFKFWFGCVQPLKLEATAVTQALLSQAAAKGDALPAVERAMAPSALLGDVWVTFKATLVISGEGESRRTRTTVRPMTYFNLQAFHSHGIDFQFYRALPNYYVGLGLLLTFLGLVAGLYFASRGMQTNDFDQARQALVLLLNTSTFKFLTSVAGIGASLLAALAARIGTRQVHTAFDRMCMALELCLPLITPEEIIQQQLAELQRQVQSLSRLDRSIDALAGAVSALRSLERV